MVYLMLNYHIQNEYLLSQTHLYPMTFPSTKNWNNVRAIDLLQQSKQFPCETTGCDKSFSRRDVMEAHMRRVHHHVVLHRQSDQMTHFDWGGICTFVNWTSKKTYFFGVWIAGNIIFCVGLSCIEWSCENLIQIGSNHLLLCIKYHNSISNNLPFRSFFFLTRNLSKI